MADIGIVTLAQAKDHLRVLGSDDDSYIQVLINAATLAAEQFQGRAYIEKSLIYNLDVFPQIIRPPYPPLISVTSIKYIDEDGVEKTLAAAKYQVDILTEPGRIMVAYNESWPGIRAVLNAVTVTYKAGYGTIDKVPEDIKQAVLLLIGHLYENRENVTNETLIVIPQGVEWLLWPKKILFRCDSDY